MQPTDEDVMKLVDFVVRGPKWFVNPKKNFKEVLIEEILNDKPEIKKHF